MIKIIHRLAVMEIHFFSSSDPPQPLIRKTNISIYSCTLKIVVHIFMRYYLFYRINTDHFKPKSFAEISLKMQRKANAICFHREIIQNIKNSKKYALSKPLEIWPWKHVDLRFYSGKLLLIIAYKLLKKKKRFDEEFITDGLTAHSRLNSLVKTQMISTYL